MRILVTGAAGFIGSHLCDRLLAAEQHAYAGRIFEDASLDYTEAMLGFAAASLERKTPSVAPVMGEEPAPATLKAQKRALGQAEAALRRQRGHGAVGGSASKKMRRGAPCVRSAGRNKASDAVSPKRNAPPTVTHGKRKTVNGGSCTNSANSKSNTGPTRMPSGASNVKACTSDCPTYPL